MKVAMVSEHASPLAALGGVDAGGQNVHVAALSEALARAGAQVVVHTRRDDADLPRRVTTPGGVTVVHVDAGPATVVPKDELLPYMDAFADELRAAWADDPPDVVHAHFWMSGLAALNAARPLGIPVVQTFHALGSVKRRHQGSRDTSPAGRLLIEETLIRDCDRILATCSDEVFELMRLGADRRRVQVAPCGVDIRHFTPWGPAEPRPDGLRRLVSVGRLVERKGVQDAIEALATVPETELVVAGGPPHDALDGDPDVRRLAAVAADLGVAHRVRFRGRVGRDELPALLRSADAVVCTPWYEPFGIVPLEAMACGVPVVASAVGGMLDTVADRVTGLLVAPHRPDQIAAAAREILDDPALHRSLGHQGVRRARTRFAWDHVAELTRSVYVDVVGETSAGRRRPQVRA